MSSAFAFHWLSCCCSSLASWRLLYTGAGHRCVAGDAAVFQLLDFRARLSRVTCRLQLPLHLFRLNLRYSRIEECRCAAYSCFHRRRHGRWCACSVCFVSAFVRHLFLLCFLSDDRAYIFGAVIICKLVVAKLGGNNLAAVRAAEMMFLASMFTIQVHGV